GFRVAAEGADGEEGVTLVRQYHPDLLLFDVRMPRMDGLQMARELARLNIKTPSVALTAYGDMNCLSALNAEGVRGFVLKTSGRTELLTAIQTVRRGESYVDPGMAGQLMASFASRLRADPMLDALSNREKAVLYWIAQGESNAEVAQRMVLSEKTVKNHVNHLLRKLELRDRTQMAVLAWRLGIAEITPENWTENRGRPRA
ncbi:MAG: response regulator transcription factor, partial [Synergistaceae bacterium]|nr:response regulator transcription factor [Synergistaceae bacterium]